MIRLNAKLISVLFAGLVATGCATSRGELDLKVPQVANPTSAQAVKITEITDSRTFEIKPKQPFIPSLQNDEINDPAITSRAIARKRNSFGQGLGDILLPEGRTVDQVVKAALTKALRESGHRVVSKGDAGYEAAQPLTAKIEKFWAWMNPGFAAIALNHNSKVLLDENWPVKGNNRTVEAGARKEFAIAAGAQWTETMNAGIEDLIEKTKTLLKKANE